MLLPPPVFDILLFASLGGMSELLPLFPSLAPATLHLALHGADALWHLRNSTPHLLILEHGLTPEWQTLLEDGQPRPAAPRTLYLGPESGLAQLPDWLSGCATALPWSGGPAPLVQQWIQQQMSQPAGQAARAPLVHAGPLRLDLHRSRLSLGPFEASLTATEAQLLAMLMRRAGQLVSREALGAACPDTASDPKKRRLDTHISNLRRKLRLSGASAASRPCIHSHRGRGYVLTVAPAQA